MDPIETPPDATLQSPKVQLNDQRLIPVNFSWQLKLLLVILGILLLILFIFSLQPQNNNNAVFPSSKPTSNEPTPSSPSAQLSSYAQTETFIQFSSQLDEYKTRLESLDLSENPLSFPLIDFNVQYEE